MRDHVLCRSVLIYWFLVGKNDLHGAPRKVLQSSPWESRPSRRHGRKNQWFWPSHVTDKVCIGITVISTSTVVAAIIMIITYRYRWSR